MPSWASDGRTLLESALKHERVVTATLIVLIPLVCWTWIVLMARDDANGRSREILRRPRRQELAEPRR